MHEVEQVIKPAARIGRRPTVKLGLHPRYPRPRPLRGRAGRCHSAARLAALQPPSLLETAAALPHVTGSPGPGVLRRLRPARPVQRSARLSRPAGRMPAAGNRNRAVPVFTAIRSAERGARLCPGGLATATPQTFTMASRSANRKACPEVPAATAHGGTHRARPISARFEPVSRLKDVTTPVPRVLLSATLAGPAPSGSTGTSRLCQGCSRPPRRYPDQAALSYSDLLRQASRRRSLTSTRITAPHGAETWHYIPRDTGSHDLGAIGARLGCCCDSCYWCDGPSGVVRRRDCHGWRDQYLLLPQGRQSRMGGSCDRGRQQASKNRLIASRAASLILRCWCSASRLPRGGARRS